jgi:hypothetical protein
MVFILIFLLSLYVIFIAVLIWQGIERMKEKKKESQNTNAQDHLSKHNFSRCEKWFIGRTYKRIKK